MIPPLSVRLSVCWDTGFLSKPDGLPCLWQPPSPGLLSYLSLLGPSWSLLLPPGVPVFRSQPILSWAILTINIDPAMGTKGRNSRGVSRTSFPRGSESKESACNAGGCVGSLGQEDPLEKGMATHSRICAWRIPWTAEPGRLQSMGSQSQTQLRN